MTMSDPYAHTSLGGAVEQGDANTIMPDVWGYLLTRHQVKSVLDLGCGFGHAMQWFSSQLVEVCGVEGWDEAVARNLVPGQVLKHDYTTGPAPLADALYDLCWCAEFVEHVEEQFIGNYMADMKRCRLVCITHAEPYQDGHHHVTLHDDYWWEAQFEHYGFKLLREESAVLRLTDRWKAGWGRRSLMLFRNLERAGPPIPVFTTPEPIYFPES